MGTCGHILVITTMGSVSDKWIELGSSYDQNWMVNASIVCSNSKRNTLNTLTGILTADWYILANDFCRS